VNQEPPGGGITNDLCRSRRTSGKRSAAQCYHPTRELKKCGLTWHHALILRSCVLLGPFQLPFLRSNVRLLSEQKPKPDFRMMKEELLDIEAILSEVAACLTVTHLDIDKAKSKLEEAREQLLNLAEGLEDSQRNCALLSMKEQSKAPSHTGTQSWSTHWTGRRRGDLRTAH